MIKLKWIYILLSLVSLSLVGCEKLIYDYPDDINGNEAKVYLSVNMRASQVTKGGFRSSINNDALLHEDAVYNLAMVVFDSATGNKIGEYFNNNVGSGVPATYAFSVELTPGSRDFYFIANMPNMAADLGAVTDRTGMDAYINNSARELNDLLYEGATETVGFPMARVYMNQVVTEGGTVYQPKPFEPKQHASEERKVVVNAGSNGADERDYVELIRVVAKLEVILDETTDLGVDKLYFRNANRHFRLIEFETVPNGYFNDNSTNAELRQLTGTNTYIYYMPETIIVTSSWSNTGNNQPINYFTIVTLDGTEYDIPIISNETSITSDYLAKAKGTVSGFTPDYNIHRNRHYQFTVKNLEQIEIIYEIDPWNLVNKSTYMGYGYNVEVDDEGNITITNTIDDCMPHKVRLVAVNGAYFGTPGDTTVEYGYESELDTNYVEANTKAGYSENFKVNSSGVTAGQPYLEVYYNKVPGVGVSPDKEFTK